MASQVKLPISQEAKGKLYQLDLNNKSMLRFVFSTTIKLVMIIMSLVAWGITLPQTGFVNWIMYFTNQSNVWIITITAIFFVLVVIARVKANFRIPDWLRIIKFLCLISITLTCIAYWLGMIIMTARGSDVGNLLTYTNLTVHFIIPALACVDYLLFDFNGHLEKWHVSLCLILPTLYLIIQILIFYMTGQYPYFCLNYGSVAGWFGFNFDISVNEGKYFMGCFYWIIVFSGILMSIGFAYYGIIQRQQYLMLTKAARKEIKIAAKEIKKPEQHIMVESNIVQQPILNKK